MEKMLTGSMQQVVLGSYAITAPGLKGKVVLKEAPTAKGRARSLQDGTLDFEQALASAGITERQQIELDVKRSTPGGLSGGSRGAGDTDVVELMAPDDDALDTVILACDEDGSLSWHFPIDDGSGAPSQGRDRSRSAAGSLRFQIPIAGPGPATGGDGRRSLVGIIGRKLLKVLVYPITDTIVSAASDFLAARWEEARRPYLLRTFTPANRGQKATPADTLTSKDWDHLCTGRALLFIHGTFSTSHGAFASMPDADFASLYQRYDGRVFAFDHFTLSADPRHNVEWFLGQLPKGKRLDVDIICHSRGGLVSRMLAEQPCAFDLDNARLDVRRVVFVAVPNQGTKLADPDHMVQMLDRLTTLLNLFPTGPVTETLEALLTVVKVLSHGALKGLDGLSAMHPDGGFLKRFNGNAVAAANGGSRYFAVAANYEPTGKGFRAFTHGVADKVLDRVFEDAPNDLVVPESGVYEAIAGNAGFPVPLHQLLRVDKSEGLVHTTLFGSPQVNKHILAWLA